LIEDGHVWTHGLGEQRRYAAYTTLINPGRAIRRRPWISPGLTSTALAAAVLLPALITRALPGGAALADVLGVAGIDLKPPTPAKADRPAVQDTLFGPTS
jgi:hypothetical protein